MLRWLLFFLFPINWDLKHSPVRTGYPFALYRYVRAKNVCLRLVCLHGAFPVFRHMNVDFCYQNCTVATNRSCGWLYQSTWGGTQAPHLRMVCYGLVLVVQANPLTSTIFASPHSCFTPYVFFYSVSATEHKRDKKEPSPPRYRVKSQHCWANHWGKWDHLV